MNPVSFVADATHHCQLIHLSEGVVGVQHSLHETVIQPVLGHFTCVLHETEFHTLG